MAITGTVTSAQGVLTLGSSLNDSITFTPTAATYTVEYPLGTVAIAASTSAQTLTLANGGQLRVLCVSGSVAYSLTDNPDAYTLTQSQTASVQALVSGAGISNVAYDGSGRVASYTANGVAHAVAYPTATSAVITNNSGASRTVAFDSLGRVSSVV